MLFIHIRRTKRIRETNESIKKTGIMKIFRLHMNNILRLRRERIPSLQAVFVQKENVSVDDKSEVYLWLLREPGRLTQRCDDSSL